MPELGNDQGYNFQPDYGNYGPLEPTPNQAGTGKAGGELLQAAKNLIPPLAGSLVVVLWITFRCWEDTPLPDVALGCPIFALAGLAIAPILGVFTTLLLIVSARISSQPLQCRDVNYGFMMWWLGLSVIPVTAAVVLYYVGLLPDIVRWLRG